MLLHSVWRSCSAMQYGAFPMRFKLLGCIRSSSGGSSYLQQRDANRTQRQRVTPRAAAHATHMLGSLGAGGVSSRAAAIIDYWQPAQARSQRGLEAAQANARRTNTIQNRSPMHPKLTHGTGHPSKAPSRYVNVKQLRFLAGLQDAVCAGSGEPYAQQPPPPHTRAAVKSRCGKRQSYYAA
jgi:ferric-dicitrate binding protein FerR (iron transport regulator)